ncbi:MULTISPECIES: alpha/beta fold hydrolase [Streptomyces]|uniref:alpha/beta fold hydrolase n=1 Tax=Streptomyces TaxID=1883 RepID=UPI0025536248|nr:alpha/beta hydrolase [Streptomyces sp. NBRC 13847]
MSRSGRIRRGGRGVCGRILGPAGILAACALLGTACGTPSPTHSALSADASADTSASSFARLVDIGQGRKMYLECHGSGSPTVILVPGLVAAADTWRNVRGPAGAMKASSSAVYPGVGRFTRVCSYDRPGTAREGGKPTTSTSVPQPTTPRTDVADLHTLLTTAKVPGPYVLVGWSAGGPIVRIYAGEYPRDVSGLVLVDAETEFLQSRLTPAQFTTFLALERKDDAKRIAQWKDVERQEPTTLFGQLRAAPPVPDVPVVVLSGDEFDPRAFRARLPAGAPANYPQIFWRAQLASQGDLARKFPGARHVTKTNSDHNIQNNQPQLVIDAVREVVDKARRRQSGTPSAS